MAKVSGVKSQSMERKFCSSIDVCEKCYEKYQCNIIGLMSQIKALADNDKRFCKLCQVPLEDDTNKNVLESRERLGSVENIKKWMILGVIIAIFSVIFIHFKLSGNEEPNQPGKLETELVNLKKKYPNQDELLWQNIWKIAHETKDSVQSFVLLYKSNAALTAECFAQDFLKIINQMHNKNYIRIYENRNNTDYGEELIKYLKVVRENKHLLVPKLQEINGETARMFHTLCDDGEHALRPSYFIFTLEDASDKIAPGLQMRSPLIRAGKILRNSWSNLLENELYPLLSRIVRNVAEISEENISC